EPPVEGAEYLDLTLPGAAIGEVQPLKFRIAKAQIEKLDPPAAAPPAGAPPKPGEIRSQPEDRK
ncbi:MAG: hypothetical protein K8T25_09675, partial [Planctomycetia bacterium]|nr:hypothetical protein [Planctomycetia bacterium]